MTPYKLAGVMGWPVAHSRSPADPQPLDEANAARIGAVNTVVVESDGSLSGRNTDGYGYIQSLLEAQPHWRADAGPHHGGGAGGAARAVLAGLIDAGAINIRLTNRSDTKGAGHGPGAWRPRPRSALARSARHPARLLLLVNTTNQGMHGQAPLDVALETLAPGALVSILSLCPCKRCFWSKPNAVDTHRARTGHAGAPGALRLKPGLAYVRM